MVKVHHKAALTAGEDGLRQALLQLVKRLTDRDGLVRDMDQTAPAGTFRPDQIPKGYPDLPPFLLCAPSSTITQLAESAIGLQDVSLAASAQRELCPIT